MAGSRKGKQVVDSKATAASPAPSSGGKRKRPLWASGASANAPSSSRGGGSGKRKRSFASASRFIDDAAVDADDSDEFDDDEDSDEGDFAEEDDELMDDIPAGAKDSKGSGKSNMPLLLKEEELSGDELEESLKKRYGHVSDDVMYEEDDKEDADRKSLLHSTADPTIWRVRCMVGHERHIAFCLIQKYVSLHVRGTNLPLISVFALEHIKGYVYIEADKQHDVSEACKGFCALYTSKISLVPANEVPRLLSIQHKSNQITEGTWVRMKNGKYKGDLAQVVTVDAVRKTATVKLVPRIDLQALTKKFGGGISLKHAAVPAPRLISSHELEDFRPHIEIRHDRETGELFEILDGLMLKDGYLYKKVSVLSLNCFGVQPSSAELMKFEPAKRDEPQLSDYISHLYGGYKGNRSETLEGSLEDKGNAFKLHDLVLFGRKDFGVIIGMKCDSFQILKGCVEEPLVVTVQRREIKNSCIDKIFTASDSHKKTIRINDAIKVLEGPQKDRQGIVKHMYKGTLFIYDEVITENTGFFCVKSELCEVMKDCHKNMGHKGSKGSGECSSMPQSPTKWSEQRDHDSVKRYGQGDGDQPFTVGQTLRIRVGPLKGYLCRVVRIYRSDVTVKLDSLVKLMTVNCKHLSVANIKNFGNPRDDTISKPAEFGSAERLSKGELVDGDIGEQSSKSSWDFKLPSSTRVSWPGLSSWGGSSTSCDDNKASNDQGDDPWGSKVTSGNGCQAGHSGSAGEQRSHPETTDGWNNWSKAEKSAEAGNDQGEDPWGSKVALGNECRTGHSGNAEEQSSQPADGWRNCTKVETSTEGEHESWKGNSTNEGERSGWIQPISSNHGHTDSWNRGGGASGRCDDKGDLGRHTDRLRCLEAAKEFGSNWAKATMDGWGNQDKAKSIEDEHKSWNSTNEGETSGWNKATLSNNGQSDSWSREPHTLGESDGKSAWGSHNVRPGHSEGGQGFGSNWGKAEKGNITNEHETGGLSKAVPSNCGHEDSWDKGAGGIGESAGKGHWGRNTDRSGHFEVGQGSGSGWDKATTGGWNKAEKSTEGESKSWKANDTNEGDTDGWSKARSYNHDQEDRWNKGKCVNGESDDKADWGGHSKGFDYGRGGGGNKGNHWDRNQGGGWSKRPDTGGEYGSSWGRGRGRNNEAYGSGDKPDGWNRSRDSDGQQARGGGRGFNGSGRGRSQDDSWKGFCSDAGWSSGRGRGRGRGRGAWEGRGSRDDYNDSSHSRHDGNDRSLGWKNDQGSSGHGDFSGNALSSWKSDQSSGWGMSTTFCKNEAFDNKKDNNHAWGGKEPFVGASSGWNSGREILSRERNERPNVNQGCISNIGWDGDKLGADCDKHVDGEQSASWQKEAANKWSTPEVCKNKQSSWSFTPLGEENVTGDDWSIKPKPSMADESGGDTSVSTGLQSSAWASKSAADEKVGKDGGYGGNWDRIKESGRKEESTWGTDKRRDWNSPEDTGNQQSVVWHHSAEHGATSSVAARDNWERGNEFPGGKDSESCDWHTAKTIGGSGSSVWGQKSRGDAGGGTGNWDNQNPSVHGSNRSSQDFGGGNWNTQNPCSGGKQASDWQNDEGNNWNMPKQHGGSHPSGGNSWSVGDGARRSDNRSGDWSGGKSYGGDQSSGWRGNMSSGRGNGRGRGRGKGFGQEQASGWRGGMCSNQEAGGAQFSFSDKLGSYGGSKPSDEHSAWSRGKDLAAGQSDDGKKETSGEEAKGAWGSWDLGAGNRPSGSGTHSDWNNSASTSGWTSSQGNSDQSNAKASAWNKGATASQDGGWEQKKCVDGAQGSDVWKSDAILSKQASGESCQGTDDWNESKGLNSNVATGWNSTSPSTKNAISGGGQGWNQKVEPVGVDRPGGWGSSNASREEPGQGRTQRDPWNKEKTS